MSMQLNGVDIEGVSIVDDNATMRETLSDELLELDITPHPLSGPYTDEDGLLSIMQNISQAAVCDHQLSPRNYAPFTGAKLVAYCFDRGFPSVLVTKYNIAEIDVIRPYRDRIPVLLTPQEATPDRLRQGFQQCIEEIYHQRRRSSRKPWQALVCIEYVDQEQGLARATIPAWDPLHGEEGIRIPLIMIDNSLHKHVKEGARFFAQVNLGAERQEDLFLTDFEFRG